MPSVKGTASVADARARNKALKKTKFPANFDDRLDPDKVNTEVLTQWIEERIASLLGFEDEIVASTVVNLFLVNDAGERPNPRRAQLDLVGFLGEEHASSFSRELWSMLLEAQSNGVGIPRVILEKKKKEMQAKDSTARERSDRSTPHMNAHRPRNPPIDGLPKNSESARRQDGDGMNTTMASSGARGHSDVAPRRRWDQPAKTTIDHPKVAVRDNQNRSAAIEGLPDSAPRPHSDQQKRDYDSSSYKDDRQQRGQHNHRHRHTVKDVDHELDVLERHMSHLQHQRSRRPDQHLEREIRHTEDKIDDLHHRRKRYRRHHQNDPNSTGSRRQRSSRMDPMDRSTRDRRHKAPGMSSVSPSRGRNGDREYRSAGRHRSRSRSASPAEDKHRRRRKF